MPATQRTKVCKESTSHVLTTQSPPGFFGFGSCIYMYVCFPVGRGERGGIGSFPAAAPVAALSAIFDENPCVLWWGVYNPTTRDFRQTREATVVICRQLVVRKAIPSPCSTI